MGRHFQLLIVFALFSSFLTAPLFAEEAALVEGQAAATVQEPLEGNLFVSLGRNLDREYPQTSFTFEPSVGYHIDEKHFLSLYSSIDRSTNPAIEFTIPKTVLTYQTRTGGVLGMASAWRVYTTALELDRWSAEGYLMRIGAQGELESELAPGLKIGLRFGPFVQASQYRQRDDGRDIPRYGFTQRLGITFEWKQFEFVATLVADQLYNGTWRNDFATTEQISVRLHENYRAGIAHEIVSSVVDDTTGFYRPVRLADGRDSRISLISYFNF